MTVALAFCVVASLVSGSAIRKPQVLGGLLLTTLLLWTYLSFMQFVIIWSGDLPAGASWYLRRSGGGWTAVLWAIAILHGVPLLLLMLPPVLRNGRMLVGLAAATLAGKALEAAWLVLPGRDVAPEWTSVFTGLAFAGLGALFCIADRFAFAGRVAARAPDSPIGEAASMSAKASRERGTADAAAHGDSAGRQGSRRTPKAR